MSVWTHVAAVFRVDTTFGEWFRGTSPEWDKITGKTIYEPPAYISHNTYELRKVRDSWNDYDISPDEFVPTGSEGSLQRLVWVEPDPSISARYCVTVYGDLRDYDDIDAIETWFDAVCSRCSIRQAVCHVMVEGRGDRIFTRTWDDEVRE